MDKIQLAILFKILIAPLHTIIDQVRHSLMWCRITHTKVVCDVSELAF